MSANTIGQGVAARIVASVPPTTEPGTAEQISEDLAEAETSQWVLAGTILIGSILLAIAANRLLRALLGRALGSGIGAALTSRLIAYMIVLLGLFYALGQLDIEVGPLIGALGLSGLVLALALQSVAENFVGAMILQTRRPFTVGDTVQLGGSTGVVRDIDARTVVLRGLDGTAIRIPNSTVLEDTIRNLTREPLRRSELTVGVAYDTNLDTATNSIKAALERVQRVRKVPRPMVVLRQFGASSIDFSIYFWHASDVPSELAATHDLMLSIHHSFAVDGITIAFPQMVVWPSHEPDANPYGDELGEVFGDHPVEHRHHQRETKSPRSARLLLRRWRS